MASQHGSRRRTVRWLVLSVGMIVWATLSPQPGPRARAFSWCLTCEPNWLLDTIDNVALFVPLGGALVYLGVRVRHAVLLAATGSLVIELLQRAGVTTGRTPSFDDLLANTAGALIGAWLVHRRAWIAEMVLHASTATARLLLLAWTVLLSAMLVLSAWAVGPVTGALSGVAPTNVAPARGTVRPSWLEVIPNLDFIQASITGTVNGTAVPGKTTGQIVAAASPTDTMRVVVMRKVIQEKDRRDVLLGFAYVHGLESTDEEMFVGQFGDDLLLRRAVNASRIGLQTPTLRVRGVFTLDSVLIWKTTRIEAMGAPGVISLRAVGPDPRIGVRMGELSLTPALGWALVQPLVGATARIAPLLTLLWLGAWFLPVGVFGCGVLGITSSMGTRRPARIALWTLLWALPPLTAAFMSARWVDVRPLTAWQLTSALAGVLAGVAVVNWRVDKIASEPSG